MERFLEIKTTPLLLPMDKLIQGVLQLTTTTERHLLRLQNFQQVVGLFVTFLSVGVRYNRDDISAFIFCKKLFSSSHWEATSPTWNTEGPVWSYWSTVFPERVSEQLPQIALGGCGFSLLGDGPGGLDHLQSGCRVYSDFSSDLPRQGLLYKWNISLKDGTGPWTACMCVCVWVENEQSAGNFK